MNKINNELKLVELGICGRPHGIGGAFSFHLENREDSVLKAGSQVKLFPEDSRSSLSPNGEDFIITSINFGNKVIVFLKGISNRNIVEEMIPFKIFINRSDFPELRDDEYYLGDLIGMDVIDHSTKKKIGVIDSLYDNSAQTVLVIKLAEETVEIPLVDHFIPLIDMDNSVVEVIIPKLI